MAIEAANTTTATTPPALAASSIYSGPSGGSNGCWWCYSRCGGLLSDEEAIKEKRGTCHDLM